MLKPSEQGFVFTRWLFWGVTWLGLLWKVNVFPSILLELPEMCVEGCQNRAHFYKMINLRGHMPRFTLKNEHFPIHLLGNPINVCWNHQNRVCFSKTIDLRGHMPRFTLKMNIFPSVCLVTLHKWVLELSEQDLFFQDDRFEGSNA